MMKCAKANWLKNQFHDFCCFLISSFKISIGFDLCHNVILPLVGGKLYLLWHPWLIFLLAISSFLNSLGSFIDIESSFSLVFQSLIATTCILCCQIWMYILIESLPFWFYSAREEEELQRYVSARLGRTRSGQVMCRDSELYTDSDLLLRPHSSRRIARTGSKRSATHYPATATEAALLAAAAHQRAQSSSFRRSASMRHSTVPNQKMF